MAQMRQIDFYKRPGVSETIHWAQALLKLGVDELNQEIGSATMGCILKYKEEQERAFDEDMRKVVAMSKNFKAPLSRQR